MSDLRRIVKSMQDEPIFSSRWFSMLTALQHITDIAVGEAKQAGAEKAGTVWERHELVVRYLLEEGKLNLTLRLLVNFKDMQRQEKFAGALQTAQLKEPHVVFDDVPTIKVKAALFEQTLGMLLSCALSAVESLQTLDMPLLLEHMARTLSFSLSHSEMVRSPDSARRQEVLCVTYLALIFGHIDVLQEDRIMDLISEHNVLWLLARNVELYHTFYAAATRIDAGKALSGILGSEDFKTSPERFLSAPSDQASLDVKKMLVSLEGGFIKENFSDFASKKPVRGLLDAISRFKYQLPKE